MTPSEQAHAALVKARDALWAFRADCTRLSQNLAEIDAQLDAAVDTAVDYYQQCLCEEIEPAEVGR